MDPKNAVTDNLMWKWEGKTDLLIQIGGDFFCHNCLVGYKIPFRARERKENTISKNCEELHIIVTSGCIR